jgi:endoglycosylceramidase
VFQPAPTCQLLLAALGAAVCACASSTPQGKDGGSPAGQDARGDGAPGADSGDGLPGDSSGPTPADAIGEACDGPCGSMSDGVEVEAASGGDPDFFPPPPPYQPTGFVGSDGRYFRDEQGRLLLLRGINVSNGNKNAPFFPAWMDKADFEAIGQRGLNVIRFVLQWEAIEPEPGKFDTSYLEQVEERVGWAAEAGLYVLLDMHQDLWGPKFLGNGAPLWATIDKGLPFDPPGGNWFMIYGEPAVCQAFQSFWDNEEGLQDHYVQAWQAVAERFAQSHAVIGYDLMNEPWIGNYGVTQIAQFEADELVPFYAKVAQGIRQVDTNHIIFVEPSATRSLGLKGGMEPLGDDNVAFAAHYYHPTMDLLGAYWDTQDNMRTLFRQLWEEAWSIGGPLFLGEWGFFVGNAGDALDADHQLGLLDEMFLSGTAWSWDPCDGGFCFISSQHEPLWSLERMTSVFPERVSGRLLSWRHDRTSRFFELHFDTTGWPAAETVVSMAPLLYPEGAAVRCLGPDELPCPAAILPVQGQAVVHPWAGLPGPYSVSIALTGPIPAPRFGLSTHIPLGAGTAGQEQELAMEQQAGARLLRTDFAWSLIEPSPGEFHFELYDPMVDHALEHGIELVALLDYGVAWARSVPGNDSSLDAVRYGQFAAAVAAHFDGRIHRFEIWNEEDLQIFFKPQPDPVKYGELLRQAHHGIKAVNPSATVIFGGLSSASAAAGLPWDFFAQTVHAHPDVGNWFDSFAIHPYTLGQSLPPEQENPAGTFVDMLTAARGMLARFGLERKPILLTEIGWPACPCPPLDPPFLIPNVSYEEQAAYLVRSALLAWKERTEAYLWYDFIDGDGSAAVFSENYFGLVKHDPDPSDALPPPTKPAFAAFSTMTGLLDQRELAEELLLPAHCHALRFEGKKGAVWALWNSSSKGQTCALSIPLAKGQMASPLALDGSSAGAPMAGPSALIQLDEGDFRYLVAD